MFLSVRISKVDCKLAEFDMSENRAKLLRVWLFVVVVDVDVVVEVVVVVVVVVEVVVVVVVISFKNIMLKEVV
jgi:hypothetical protein